LRRGFNVRYDADLRAYHGPDAIGTNDEVGRDRCTVLERDSPRVVVD
jgi:hypothetical protein